MRRTRVLLLCIVFGVVSLLATTGPGFNVADATPGPPSPTPGPTLSPRPTDTPGPPTPTPAPSEEVSEDVPPGGTATTDTEGDGATPDDPVETSVTVPDGGEVTIDEGPITEAPPSGYQMMGQQVDISAPQGTIDSPLTISFTLDSSVLNGADPSTIAIVRDGTVLPDCTGQPFTTTDDACVQSRELSSDGDGVFTIETVHASTWNMAQVAPSPPPQGHRCSAGGPIGRTLCRTVSFVARVVRHLLAKL